MSSTDVAKAKKEEDVEVRREDQDMINEFGRLNNRLLELRVELKQLSKDSNSVDDASSDLMMVEGGKVFLYIGESFIETTEEDANEYCEKKQEEIKALIDSKTKEEVVIVSRQDELKKILYGRFGDSINLEG